MRGTIGQISISPGGLPKTAILSGRLTGLGIEGDNHAHPRYHGGVRKALLLITAEGIEELIQLGYPLFFGALGENITTIGLDRRKLRLGHRYRLGEALIELTENRRPCAALDLYGDGIQRALFDPLVRAGNYSSSRWGSSGFYAAVLEPTVIYPGDRVQLEG